MTQQGQAAPVADGEVARPGEAQPAVIVSAADYAFSRCLDQMLLSAERHGLHRVHRFIAYDLGLTDTVRRFLEQRYDWCELRTFDFDAFPEHFRLKHQTYAWKPIIIRDVLNECESYLFWFDSATIFKTGLDEPISVLDRYGTYTTIGQSPMSIRCDPAVMALLDATPDCAERPVRFAGMLGLDARHDGARALAAQWGDLALDPDVFLPSTPLHNADQAVMTVLLYKLEDAGVLRLNDGEIDISSRNPIRWMTSRNKIPPTLPRWADPLARAYYTVKKRIDHLYLVVQDLRQTPPGGKGSDGTGGTAT